MAPLSWTRPNGAIEELPEDPEWELPKTRYPEANTKPMVPATFISMFTSDQWFLDEGRHLTRYEAVFIMRLVFFGDDYLMYIKTFEYFANPDYFLTVACQSINESSKYAWISKVEKWLVELRGLHVCVDKGHAESSILLFHSTGRLPDLPILEKDRPKVKNHRTREDQFFLIHALLSFCRDSKGNKLDDGMARTVYYKYFGIGFSGGIISIFKILADPNHRFTIIVARSMADHKLENFFGNKAHEMLKEMDPKAKSCLKAMISYASHTPWECPPWVRPLRLQTSRPGTRSVV